MASTKKSSLASAAASEARRQAITQAITSSIEKYFKSTLGTQNDIVNIVRAIIFHETRFNWNINGVPIPPSVSSGIRDYWNSQPVQSLLPGATGDLLINLKEGTRAIGLGQVMGLHLIRKASKKDGKCLVELYAKKHPELVDYLCVNAGESLSSKYLGEQNVDRAITASLLVLETKWMACKPVQGGWKIGSKVFPLRISASVAGYLGLGAKDVITGLTPEAYTANIVGGPMYVQANGASAPLIRDSAVQYASTSSAGPAVPVASNGTVPGCVNKKPA